MYSYSNNNMKKYNNILIKLKYDIYSNNDENGNFKFSNYNHKDYDVDEYLIINEILNNNYKYNVNYYFDNIYSQTFYDINSIFMKKRIKLFNEIQQFNLKISRIFLFLKLKYKKSKNNTNLYLEDLKPNHATIIDKNIKYKFDYYELYNIVDSSFKHMNLYEPVILNIKNPYTNQKFDFYNVINIYFLLLFYGRIPTNFFLYFKNNFSKLTLYNKFYLNLLIDNIENNYKSLSNYMKKIEIDKMLKNTNHKLFLHLSQELKLEYLNCSTKYYYVSIKLKIYLDESYDWLIKYYYDKCKRILFILRVFYHKDLTKKRKRLKITL